MKENELILELRKELYTTNFESIDWPRQCNNCSPHDIYYPHTNFHNVIFYLLSIYEMLPNSWIRHCAQKNALEHIRAEDKNTDFADLAPVSKMMNMIVIWMNDGPESYEFKRHVDRNLDFLWMANDGMRCNGTNGSQVWDAAFTCQAAVESGIYIIAY